MCSDPCLYEAPDQLVGAPLRAGAPRSCTARPAFRAASIQNRNGVGGRGRGSSAGGRGRGQRTVRARKHTRESSLSLWNGGAKMQT